MDRDDPHRLWYQSYNPDEYTDHGGHELNGGPRPLPANSPTADYRAAALRQYTVVAGLASLALLIFWVMDLFGLTFVP